jgi:hypothetical protein
VGETGALIYGGEGSRASQMASRVGPSWRTVFTPWLPDMPCRASVLVCLLHAGVRNPHLLRSSSSVAPD